FFIPSIRRLYVMLLSLAAALMRAIHNWRNSRFLARRSRYAYFIALLTASVAVRSKRLRAPKNPLASFKTFFLLLRALTLLFILDISFSPHLQITRKLSPV